MLSVLNEASVDYMLVGAHALAVHGVVRSTGDLDIWVRPTSENASRVVAALHGFGAPLDAHGVSASDFARSGTVYQLGLPPARIDILTEITGVGFDEAWAESVEVTLNGLTFRVLGPRSLRANKLATGREKDVEDVRRLDAALHGKDT